jgi:hypothetical protein
MEYLLQSLRGEPLDKVKGLGIQGSSYTTAIDILHKKYGNLTIRREKAVEALTGLPKVRDNWTNLGEYLNQLQWVITSLERAKISKEAIDTHVIPLYGALPANLKKKLHEMRVIEHQEDDSWEMEHYVEQLNTVQRINPKGVDTIEKKRVNTPAPAFYQGNDIKVKEVARNKYPCAFCGVKGHFSDLCRTVKDISRRREILAEKKLCFSCLVGGHRAKECKRQKPCFTCKKDGHHASVCHGKKSPDQREHQSNASTSSKKDINPSFFAMGEQKEQIIMATSKVTVINPRNDRRSVIHIYLDTGAKFTAVKESVVQELGLNPPKDIELETARFNSKTHDKMKVGIVQLDLLGRSGQSIAIQAFTTKDIAAPIHLQPMELSQKQKRITDRYKPNNLPSKERETLIIDMIVGLDHWFQIMGPKAAHVVEVGEELYIYCTPIGNIITGVVSKGLTGTHNYGATSSFPVMFCDSKIDRLWDPGGH